MTLKFRDETYWKHRISLAQKEVLWHEQRIFKYKINSLLIEDTIFWSLHDNENMIEYHEKQLQYFKRLIAMYEGYIRGLKSL